MIDYQSKFKQKLIILLLIIFIVPLLIVLYFGEKSHINVKSNPLLSIQNSTTLHLRGTIRDIKLSKDSKTAYVAAASRGIYILDISNVLKPKLISQFKYFKNSYDKARKIALVEDKNMLFVQDAQSGLYSIDITNLSEPKLLSTYKPQALIYTFCVSKNTNNLYISDADGIKIVNIKNPDEIKLVAQYNTKKKYFSIIEVKKHLLYLLSSNGIDIVDTSFSKKLKFVGNYIAAGDPKNITLSYNKTRAFLSNGYSGVEILNISNKLNPKAIGLFATTKIVENTVVSKDAHTIYILNANGSIEIVDIKNPDNAKHLQEIKVNPSTKTKVWNIALSEKADNLVVADGIVGIKTIKLK
ncbi:LVIVD repeat-containing protein [Sulfurimonas sp.]